MADDTLVSADERRRLLADVERYRRARNSERWQRFGVGAVAGVTAGDGVPGAQAISAARRAMASDADTSIADRLEAAKAQAALEEQQAKERESIRKYDYDTLVATQATNDKIIEALKAVAVQASQSGATVEAKKLDLMAEKMKSVQAEIDASPITKLMSSATVQAKGQALAEYVDSLIAKADPAKGEYAPSLARQFSSPETWDEISKHLRGASPEETAAILADAERRLPTDAEGMRIFARLRAEGRVVGPDGVSSPVEVPAFADQQDPNAMPGQQVLSFYGSGMDGLRDAAPRLEELQGEFSSLYDDMKRRGVAGAERSMTQIMDMFKEHGLVGAVGGGDRAGAGEGGSEGGQQPVSFTVPSQAADMIREAYDAAAAGDQTAASMLAEIYADPTFTAAMKQDRYSDPEMYLKALMGEAKGITRAAKQQDRRHMRTGVAPENPIEPLLVAPPPPEEAPSQAALDAATIATLPGNTEAREPEPAAEVLQETQAQQQRKAEEERLAEEGDDLVAQIVNQRKARRYGRLGRRGA